MKLLRDLSVNFKIGALCCSFVVVFVLLLLVAATPVGAAQDVGTEVNIQGTYDRVYAMRSMSSGAGVATPVADFTLDPAEGEIPLTVQFTDDSTGDNITWLWHFENGVEYTSQDMIYTFNNPGTYNVSLTVTNEAGSDTKYALVKALEPPVAEIYLNPLGGNAPLDVLFYDDSTGDVITRLWDFGDGEISSEPAIVHPFPKAGNYTIKLNVSNGYTSDSDTHLLCILEKPVAAFSLKPSEGMAPLNVSFSDLSTGDVTSWKWDFGDGADSTEQSPFHEYALNGTYPVTLTVGNAYSSDINGSFVHVLPPPPPEMPVAAFSLDPEEGRAPLNVSFTDLSTGNVTAWKWDFGDGANSTEQNPFHEYTDPGEFTVSLNVTNADGSDINQSAVHVLPAPVPGAPVAAFSLDPSEGDAPLNVSFTDLSTGNVTAWNWDFGDGANSTEQNPFHEYTDPGEFTVILNVTNAYGSDSNQSSVKVLLPPHPDAPVAAFSLDPSSGKVPLSVSFTDLSTGNVTAWKWDFGDGANSTEQNPFHEYTDAGTYSVSLNVTNAYGSDILEKTTCISVTKPASRTSSRSSGGGTSDLSVSSQSGISKGDSTDFTFKKTSIYLITQIAGTDIPSELITVGGCGCPSGAPASSDEIYQYIELTLYHTTDESVAKAYIYFTVSRKWLEEYGFAPEDVSMYRYHDGEWQLLSTDMTGEDATNYYFTATSSGYSVFAIGANQGSNVEEEPPKVVTSEGTPEQETPTYKANPEIPDAAATQQQTPPWWGTAILGAGAALLLRRGRA